MGNDLFKILFKFLTAVIVQKLAFIPIIRIENINTSKVK